MPDTNKTEPQTLCACYLTLFGKVQDAEFLPALRHKAQELTLTGWVSCNPLGHVAAFLQGKSADIQYIISCIYAGRYGAHIDHIALSRQQVQSFTDFKVLKQVPPMLATALARERLSTSSMELAAVSRSLEAKGIDKGQAQQILLELPKRYWRETFKKSSVRRQLHNASASFTTEVWSSRVYSRELAKFGPSPTEALQVKKTGRAFALSLGFKAPEVYQHNVRFAEVDCRDNIVIKPVGGAGSRGVYLVNTSDKIFALRNKKYISSWDTLRHEVNRFLSNGRHSDSWIVEELIKNPDGTSTPPHDLKFYCFYGKIPVVLEVARSPKGLRYCWWDANSNIIQTGKYDTFLFRGDPIAAAHLEMVAQLSLDIPAPFLRIDFLRSAHGLVFTEFAAEPGGFHQFNASTDAQLGMEFAAARGRLTADLLNGKRFSAFEECLHQPLL